MGDCYSVELRVKLRKSTKSNMQKLLRQWMREESEGTDCTAGVNWSLALNRKHGIRPDTFGGICKILLAFHQGYAKHVVDRDGFDLYRSGFNASYSWYRVMVNAFLKMAWALEDGSRLWIDREEGMDTYAIEINDEGEVEVWENHDHPLCGRRSENGSEIRGHRMGL